MCSYSGITVIGLWFNSNITQNQTKFKVPAHVVYTSIEKSLLGSNVNRVNWNILEEHNHSSIFTNCGPLEVPDNKIPLNFCNNKLVPITLRLMKLMKQLQLCTHTHKQFTNKHGLYYSFGFNFLKKIFHKFFA